MPTEIRQVIANCHLFSGLDPGLMDDIAASATRKKLGANQLLFQKGDHADALWGVLSGRIVIEVRADDGKGMILDEFHAGDVFGEVGVLDFGPRRVEASAACESELFRLERSVFLEHLQSNPELCFRVFSLLCGHLRDTTETLEDSALYKLPGRLAKRLVLMSNETTGDDDRAVLNVVQSDLARMMGVNREAVNRHLRAWEKSGWISIKRQSIEILEQKSLEGLAAPGQTLESKDWGNNNLSGLTPLAFLPQDKPGAASDQLEKRFAGVLAVSCTEYAGMLMTDSAKTVKHLKAGLAIIDKAILKHGGRLIWSAGERTLAEFPDASSAFAAALDIQKFTADAGLDGRQNDPIFRIGVHAGKVLASEDKFIGEPVTIAIRLTELSSSGGICITADVRNALLETGSLELHYLGKHELKNVTSPVSVFSARPVPWLKRTALWADSMLPRRFRPVMSMVAVLFAVSLVWLAGDRFGMSKAPEPPVQSIAVMSFTLKGEPDNAYLANGLADEIRVALTAMPETLVIGGQSSRYFEEWNATSQEIGEILQVAYVLQGVVSLKGEQLNLTSSLVETGKGTEIWHQNYQGSLQQFNEFQTDIIRQVNETLHGGATSSESGFVAPPVTENQETYALYLQARALIHLKTRASLVEALGKLEKVLESVPDFASAHVAMAETYWHLTYYTDYYQEPNIEPFRLARPHVDKAIAIDPNLAEAHVMLGIISEGEDEGDVESVFRTAISLNPSHARAHLWLGVALANDDQLRSWNEPIQHVEKAHEIEPLSVEAATNLVNFLQWFPQRQDEAWEILDKLKSYFPDHPDVNLAESTWLLHKGRTSDAMIVLEKITDNDPNNATALMLQNIAWYSLGANERAMQAPTSDRQYRFVLSPDREESLKQMKLANEDAYAFLSAYIFVMLREWQSAIDVLAGKFGDMATFEKQYATVVAKRYSPAMSLAIAYNSLGDVERSRVFAGFERYALNIKSENGKIHNSEYSTAMARLYALDGHHSEAMYELEQLITSGPNDPRELLHPVFDEMRNDPAFKRLEGLQRQRVNTEREKLGLEPLLTKKPTLAIQ